MVAVIIAGVVFHETTLLPIADWKVSHRCFIREHSTAIWTFSSVDIDLVVYGDLFYTLYSFIGLDHSANIRRAEPSPDNLRLLLPLWYIIFLDLTFLH